LLVPFTVLALRRWGQKHKTPFFLSLITEYLARLIRLRSFNPPGGNTSPLPSGNPLLMAMMGDNPLLSLLGTMMGSGQGAASKEARPISDVEKIEWEKRNRAFWWYLLRGPVWHSWTRPKLDAIVKRTQDRPLLGIVGGFIGDYLPLVDEYYYYSAT
jgi:peroxin-16